jgi:hypothetical protein
MYTTFIIQLYVILEALKRDPSFSITMSTEHISRHLSVGVAVWHSLYFALDVTFFLTEMVCNSKGTKRNCRLWTICHWWKWKWWKRMENVILWIWEEADDWAGWYETYHQTSEGTILILFVVGNKSDVNTIYWRLCGTQKICTLFCLCFWFFYTSRWMLQL